MSIRFNGLVNQVTKAATEAERIHRRIQAILTDLETEREICALSEADIATYVGDAFAELHRHNLPHAISKVQHEALALVSGTLRQQVSKV